MLSDYEKTPEGSYRSKCFEDPTKLYSDDYWSHRRGHSTLDEQITNVIEKNELVLGSITHIPPKNALEIACAPGILLSNLKRLGFKCSGIEVDSSNAADILRISEGADIIFGLFPDVTKNFNGDQFSNIIALDVLEHVEQGVQFLAECNRLLVLEGILILQAPIIFPDGVMDDKMFNSVEHIWIYSLNHLTRILNEVGFDIVSTCRWKPGHEQVVARKRLK